MQARLSAAVAGLHSIVRMDQDRERIIVMQDRALKIADGIVAKYGTVDKNNQTIDTNQIQTATLFQGIINDKKEQIGDLEHKLDSCQSNQKWIAGLSALGGGYLGYKLGKGGITNPFSSFTTAQSQGYPLSFYQQTAAEKAMREALKQR